MTANIPPKNSKSQAAKLDKVLIESSLLSDARMLLLLGEYGAQALGYYLAVLLTLGNEPGAALPARYLLPVADLCKLPRDLATELIGRFVEEGLLTKTEDGEALTCGKVLEDQRQLKSRRDKWAESKKKAIKGGDLDSTRNPRGIHEESTRNLSGIREDSTSPSKEKEKEEEKEEEKEGVQGEESQATTPAASTTPKLEVVATPTPKAKPPKITLTTKEALVTALSAQAPALVTPDTIEALTEWAFGTRAAKHSAVTPYVIRAIAREYENPELLLTDLRTCISAGWTGLEWARKKREQEQARSPSPPRYAAPKVQSDDEFQALLAKFVSKEN